MALKGHFLTQLPQPRHKVSEMKQIVEVLDTSTHNFAILFTRQVFLHSCLHFLGLHLSGLMIAILSLLSSILDNETLLTINNKH
jgi:hypothetical protein